MNGAPGSARESATVVPVKGQGTAGRMRRTRATAIVGALALVLGGAYVAADAADVVPGALTTRAVEKPADPPVVRVAAGPRPSVLNSGDAAQPDPALRTQIAALWKPAARAAAAGHWRTWAQVEDARSGRVLLRESAAQPHVPASSAKLFTAFAALSTLDENRVLATGTSRVGSDLYLWGEGDLLLARGAGSPRAVNGRAGLADLAGATARALRRQGIERVSLRYRPQIFSGALRLAEWKKQGVDEYVGRPGAFAIDAGRTGAGDVGFDPDPGGSVARAFASELRAEGVQVDAQGRGAAPDGAREVARVTSAPVGSQIRLMLKTSDNTLAEQYCRLTAAADHRGTGEGEAAAGAVRTATDAGVDTSGVRLLDCSGLSANDRATAQSLAGILRATWGSQRPQLRDLARSLPVGGVDGTLDERFTSGAARANVQAKTGSLGGATTLTGEVTTAGGRDLIFSLGNDSVPGGGAYLTRRYLDEFVSGLAELD